MKKIFKWIFISVVSFVVILIAGIVVVPKVVPAFGGQAKGEQLIRMEESPNYEDGRFVNIADTEVSSSSDSMFKTLMKFIRGGNHRSPSKTIETNVFDKDKFAENDSSLSMTWFGHSTVLLKVEKYNLLIDPVFSTHASPFSFMGPQAFPYTNTYAIDDLPGIDAVLISHDHYDHLDYETILILKDKVSRFYVPLGLAAHLERWGVPATNIEELDWWDEIVFDDQILLALVPMRHFSGRGVADRFCTLWGGWVIKSGNHSVIHTGDSGYGEHFTAIGEKYGPFDLTMVECGQYNPNWKYIHMMPEETVQAHIDLKGKYLLPIHWGRFALALHSWTDPIVRATAEAKLKNVNLITPTIGQTITMQPPLPHENWWSAFY